MTREGGTGGNVAALLIEGRKKARLNQTQLAERADVSRSRIIAAESRAALPTLELCLKLARALGVPAVTMFRAHTRDYLGEADPTALSELGSELWGGNSQWETIAEHHGLRIAHGRYTATVNRDGDLTLTRRLSGCVATRPRQVVFFLERIIGERPPAFAIKGSPKGLGYTVGVSIEGEWAQHRVELERLWTADDGPFDFEFETLLPRAYVLSLEEGNERRKLEGLPPLREYRGDFRLFVNYAFEALELVVVFPDGYVPAWGKPTATWGNSPMSAYDFTTLTEKCCGASRFAPGKNQATLALERPAPGYSFGIRWTPDPEWIPVPGPGDPRR